MIRLRESFITKHFTVLCVLFIYFLSISQISTASSQDINTDLPICNKSQNSFILNSSSSVIQNFSSPNYPKHYPHYSNCIWVIIAPIGHLIKLTFSTFSIYATSDSTVLQCRYAYLQVIEEDKQGNIIEVGRFCGSRTPQTIYSTGGKLRVVFKNTLLTSAKGFVAKYTAVRKGLACSTQNTLDENSNILLQAMTTGVIKPPQFPDSSGPIDCTWKIALPKHNGVNITLTSFIPKQQGSCSDSALEVYNGQYGQGHGARLGLFCDKTGLRIIYSSGRYLSLRWRAVSGKVSANFEVGFRSVEQSKQGSCDASNKEIFLSGRAGSIFSPGYPVEYPNSIECTWKITVPPGQYVKLHFEAFQLEPGSSCSDNIVVKESNVSLTKFCGSSLPGVLVSPSRHLYVTFSSNLATSGKGFLAVFEATTQGPKISSTPGPQPGVCSPLNTRDMNNNLKLSGSSGFVMSPMYPKQYPNRISCTWVISVSKDKRIHLEFEDFWIDDQHGCQGDFLEIRDGKDQVSTMIGSKHCGNKKPSSVYSTGAHLWLQFMSDSAGTSHGFKAKYSEVSRPFNRFIAVGIGIGAIALLLIVILVYWKIKKKRNKDEEHDDDHSDLGTIDRVTPGNTLLENGSDRYNAPPNEYTVSYEPRPYAMETFDNNGDHKNNVSRQENDEKYAWFKPNKRKFKTAGYE